uniref:Uncharacterized protein n=1 Tax=Anguilla anguilla TaxID=7936 RepID=A0A0E9WR43_ANGAN
MRNDCSFFILVSTLQFVYLFIYLTKCRFFAILFRILTYKECICREFIEMLTGR